MNYQKRHQEAGPLHVAKARKSSIYRPRDTEIVGWVYELRVGLGMVHNSLKGTVALRLSNKSLVIQR